MIKWKFSLKDQENSYLSCFSLIKKGFFQEHRFYLLPYLPEKFRDRVVYLPKIDSKGISYLTQRIYKKHQSELKQLEKDFLETKKMVIPKVQKSLPLEKTVNMTISPALFGPNGLYEIKGRSITIRPRYDRNIQEVYKLMVNALVHFSFFNSKKLYQNPKIWREKQKLTDEIFLKLNLAHILSNPKGTLYTLEKSYSAKLACESFRYFSELRPLKSRLEYAQIFPFLTKNERAILKVLTANKNKIVSFDLIATELWQEKVEEKFSLYAITKGVERLRKKIKKKAKISLIHTQRGQGYLLYD